MKNRGIFWGALTGIVFLDILTKFGAQKYLFVPHKILPFLKLEFVENSNLAFGIEFPRVWIILLSLVALGILGNIFVKNVRKTSKIGAFAFGIIFGGALANLGERIIFAHVTDFVALSIIPNFNLADTALTLGVATLIAFHSKIFKKN
ncbi:MAG: signal peptidase II [Patescibacteria group bacterium]